MTSIEKSQIEWLLSIFEDEKALFSSIQISSKLVSVERTVLEHVISTRAGVKSKFVFLVGAFLCTLSAFSKTISRVVDRGARPREQMPEICSYASSICGKGKGKLFTAINMNNIRYFTTPSLIHYRILTKSIYRSYLILTSQSDSVLSQARLCLITTWDACIVTIPTLQQHKHQQMVIIKRWPILMHRRVFTSPESIDARKKTILFQCTGC